MARTLQKPIVDYNTAYTAFVVHVLAEDPWDPAAQHWAGYGPFYGSTEFKETCVWFNTLTEARLAAQLFAALPQIMGVTCKVCHDHWPGPEIHRWNIYRGENKHLTPLTFYVGLWLESVPPEFPPTWPPWPPP